jgi:hypothetical protein
MSTHLDSSDPRCVADALDLGYIDDEESALDPSLLQRIYRYCRNEDGRRVLYEHDATFARGWINLDNVAAAELIAVFVALDDADTIKQARNIARNNLESAAWNDVLGIDSPPIKCVVKIHGQRWGLRFQSAEPAMRGKEIVNEQLPPIPPSAAATSADERDVPPTNGCSRGNPSDRPPGPAVTEPPPSPNQTAQPTAEEVLRKAGLPT